MPLNPTDSMHRLRGAGYYVGIVVLIAHITEIFIAAWPPRVHSPSWRITFISGTANTVFMTLLVMFIMTAIAVIANDRRVTFVLAALSALAAITFLGLSGTFALDALQMRNQVRQQLSERYDYAAAWVLVRELIGMIGFWILTVTAFRSARGMKIDVKGPVLKGPSLIVGGGGVPASMPAERIEERAGAPEA